MIYTDFDATVDYAPDFSFNNRKHFFKYMSTQTAKIVVNAGTLRWSRSAMLNDPFDMNFDLPLKPNRDAIKTAALKACWKQFVSDTVPEDSTLHPVFEWTRSIPADQRERAFKTQLPISIDGWLDTMQMSLPSMHVDAAPLLRDLKILSLTVRPDIPTMWAHYADSYRGVVLRFKSADKKSPFFMAKPVDYVSELPDLFTDEELIDHITARKLITSRMAVDKIIYTKSIHWSYEQEWRISLGSGRDKDKLYEDQFFGMEELDGIIFGLGTTEDDREILSMLARKHEPMQLMQLKRDRGRFGLYIENL
ncbi:MULTISPECIES: DUF2971 domain-containing protein [unclassified Rhizobium]|uniref:DUF2971 domain-containing protein n=1 Tax=unclassified Rhizobium TaxID=2613769 RepID=UPI001AD9B69D|nr:MULTISPECIES: DUF2971 domain-containing protein [unclassified Rhizobium]MBO9124925.1 DUF2971 domain-containing protein [Rhizobium sp. 16-488-2b]MBO9175510.1 DUF2971 domain-containing protein [Rhizobium sp. 16-488-2a]